MILIMVDTLRAHGAGPRIKGDFRGLSEELPTIAERFAEAGYGTQKIITNPDFNLGLGRGFESFYQVGGEGADVAAFAPSPSRIT